jgi:hypothetical protein
VTKYHFPDDWEEGGADESEEDDADESEEDDELGETSDSSRPSTPPLIQDLSGRHEDLGQSLFESFINYN